MGELLFPLAAMGLTFLVLIPALTLVSRAALARKRARVRAWAAFGSEVTFAWLVAPTLLPVAWLTSSALHQSEPSRAGGVCLIEHEAQASACLDALLLLAIVLGAVAVVTLARGWRARPRVALDVAPAEHAQARRVAALVQGDERLRGMRVQVTQGASAAVCAVGWLRPRVFVDEGFAEAADDAMLRAALLHERAHAASRDALRDFVARLCLRLNPVGGLLGADLERWRQAREAQCDGEAVAVGGDPLALAQGIVRAARGLRAPGAAGAARLCGDDARALKLRIALLLHGPERPRRTQGHVILGVVVLGLLITPHLGSAGLLEQFHHEVERLLGALH